MDFLKEAIEYVLGLGASIFVPIIMICIGILVGQKPSKAILSGLTLGVAFTAMNVILEFMFVSISPVTTAFTQNTSIELSTVDIGWSPMAAISWAWPYALIMFPLQIGINLIMLSLRLTDVLNVDLWNVWNKVFTALIVSTISGSVIFGFIAGIIQIIAELVFSSSIQKRVQELTNIPGVTCSQCMALQAVWMNPLNKILDRIPFLGDIHIDIQKLKRKIGIFSENSVMGFIIGLLLAIFAGYSLSDSLKVAIKVASSLVLFPTVANLFLQALSPIAESAGEFMKRKYNSREIFVGLDWPFLAGRSEIWIVSIILVPIEIALCFILAKMGLNNVIPLVGIINITVCVPAFIITNGNILRMLIIGTVFTPFYLIVSSLLAPTLTTLAKTVSTIEIPAGQMVTFFGIEVPLFRYVLSLAFSGKILGIALLITFILLLVWLVMDFKKSSKVKR